MSLIQLTWSASLPSMDFANLLGVAQNDYPFRNILLIFAVVIAAQPMLVIHEFGHLIMARLMGMRIFEFNIGSGRILWERKIRGIHFTLRCVPLSGHVNHLVSDATTRFSLFAFIAGGPLANLLAAGVIYLWSNANLADYFTEPSLAAVLILANLWIAIESLLPIPDRSATSIARGTDGWQLWRIARGKPTSLQPDEITSSGKKVGMSALQRHARLTRIAQHILAWLLVIFGVGLSLIVLPVARLITNDSDDSLYLIGAICIVGVIVIVAASFLALGILLLRKEWKDFASAEAKVKFSPLRKKTTQYRLLLINQIERWEINDLPEDVRLRLYSWPADEDMIPFLEDIREKWPSMTAVHILLYDCYMPARRYSEAQREIETVLERDDLLDPVRFHLETCLLSAQLSASADDATIARCQEKIDDVTDDGLKIWRAIDLSFTIITAKHVHRLGLARKWCELAREIYPYDASIFLQSAIIHIEQNDIESAKSDLKSAKQLAQEHHKSAIRAWLAIVAASDHDPKAGKLLDQSLKENLPLHLKQRLEEARQKLSSPGADSEEQQG